MTMQSDETKMTVIQADRLVAEATCDQLMSICDRPTMLKALSGILARHRLTTLSSPAQGERLGHLAREYRPTMDRDVLHSWAGDVVAQIFAALDTADNGAAGEVPEDVRRLVFAARKLYYESDHAGGAMDPALEAFANRVPWDDQPAPVPQSGAAGKNDNSGAKAVTTADPDAKAVTGVPQSATGGDDFEGAVRMSVWNACRKRGMGQDASQEMIRAVIAEPLMQAALRPSTPAGEKGE